MLIAPVTVAFKSQGHHHNILGELMCGALETSVKKKEKWGRRFTILFHYDNFCHRKMLEGVSERLPRFTFIYTHSIVIWGPPCIAVPPFLVRRVECSTRLLLHPMAAHLKQIELIAVMFTSPDDY